MNALLPPALWLLKAASQPVWRRFNAALDHPAEAQRRVLADILADAARTPHGRARGLATGNPQAAFERMTPVGYDDLRATIDADLTAGGHSFSVHPARFYERTSGSTGAAKLIPYNRRLRQAFDAMFRIWACDLLQHGLKPRSGRCFMSVSPPLLGVDTAPGGARLGTQDDTEYLSGPMAWLLRPFLVAPTGVLGLRTGDDFKDVLVAALLAEAQLEVVSVWNPTFWLILLGHLQTHLPRLADELRQGQMTRGGRRFRFRPVNAHRLARVPDTPDGDWTRLWPALQLISCWSDAEAARPAAALRAAFPGVHIQGKGLLATEAPVTLPLCEAPAPVPLIDRVYLELETADGRLLPLAQWRDGDEGEVVLTTPGGLLRYRLRDRVAVTGVHRATPCLRFLGRAGGVVDLVGEKLSEAFVREVLMAVAPTARLLTLCPVADGQPPHYLLLSDRADAALAGQVERGLSASPPYRIARALGQIGPVRVLARPGLVDEVHAFWQREGVQAGNVKERALVVDTVQAGRLWRALGERKTRG